VNLTDYSGFDPTKKEPEEEKPSLLKENLFLLDDMTKPMSIGPHMLA
jgi:hypothetical protein